MFLSNTVSTHFYWLHHGPTGVFCCSSLRAAQNAPSYSFGRPLFSSTCERATIFSLIIAERTRSCSVVVMRVAHRMVRFQSFPKAFWCRCLYDCFRISLPSFRLVWLVWLDHCQMQFAGCCISAALIPYYRIVSSLLFAIFYDAKSRDEVLICHPSTGGLLTLLS